MNKAEYKIHLTKSYEKTLAMLDRVPEDVVDDVGHFASDGFSFNIHYDEMIPMLSKLRRAFGLYEMQYYFETCGSLAIRYTFEESEIDVHFYCSDFDNALNKIGKGKCTVEEVSKTEKKIVCGI